MPSILLRRPSKVAYEFKVCQVHVANKGTSSPGRLLLRPLHSIGRCNCRQVCAASKASKDGQQGECLPQKAVRWTAWVAAALVAGAFLTAALSPADARVATEKFEQAPGLRGDPFGGDRSSSSPRDSKTAGPSVREQVNEVLRLTADAKQATSNGDYQKALDDYTVIVRRFPDLAITNYAKIGRALLLYQTGSKSQAILELEDLEVSLRGYAEVHAALASIIYNDRPRERDYAEAQFDLASEFDSRYGDVKWVADAKAWPPAMLQALDNFVHLK